VGKREEIAFQMSQRAEELRAIAEDIKDPETRRAMLDWANDYERIAMRAIELGTYPSPKRS
jgi:hypothetical protein